MESLIASAPAGTRWPTLLAVLEDQCRTHENLVVSWGFMPGQDEPIVQALRGAGFLLFWLDGNREAARRAFVQRGTVSVELLDAQMARIAQLDLDALGPTVVDPFDDSGEFRTEAQIVAGILAAADAAQ